MAENQNTQTLISEIADDVTLGKKLVAAYKTGGKSAVLALLPEVVAEGQQDIAAVEAALPEIKVGYKTTEFWLMVALFAGNAVYLQMTGRALPLDVNVTLAALTGIYTVIRGLIKSKSAPAATSAAK
jgi:hypothetical protein